MFTYVRLKRLLYRKFLTLVLILYFLMITLFFVNLDSAGSRSKATKTFSLTVLDESPHVGRDTPVEEAKSSSPLLKNKFTNINSELNPKENILGAQNEYRLQRYINAKTKLTDPVPLLRPKLDARDALAGDFLAVGDEAYVYSAFLDDRKASTFVRIMMLMSQPSSHRPIYCYFNQTTDPQVAERYELCENHDAYFGGYIFSCQIPQVIDIRNLDFILISIYAFGSKVVLPLSAVRPPGHKITFLDSYPQSFAESDNINYKTNNNNVPLTNSNITKVSPSFAPQSFAICVSPLFGDISVHRLIEFVELSRILGAEHFIFYNSSLSTQVSDVLQYYVSQKVASVLPWTLPADVTDVWYNGQLLANNDCLYRTMSLFDLVSFNDIDEFIVPHSKETTWKETFPSLLTDDRCGLSFQSAFYGPGLGDHDEKTLQTPAHTVRSQMYSKVRTKVMLSPWRVFEVGIHHISKQNREEWRPYQVEPSIAYLHHYRTCVPDYGMDCTRWENDTIIANRYLSRLTEHYEAALKHVLVKNIQKKGKVVGL